MKYFKQFNSIIYQDKIAINILLRAAIIRNIMKKFEVFYPYTVTEGERPDTIAYDYYGDSNYWWVVLLSNDIIDPYYDWVLSQDDLNKYLIKKYNTNIESIMSTAHHYEYTGIGGNQNIDVSRINWPMTPETYSKLSIEEKAGWAPVTIYEYENALNEEKRNIKLLDNDYLDQLATELSNIFQ